MSVKSDASVTHPAVLNSPSSSARSMSRPDALPRKDVTRNSAHHHPTSGAGGTVFQDSASTS